MITIGAAVTKITVRSPQFFRTEVWVKQPDGKWLLEGTTLTRYADSLEKRINNDAKHGYTVIMREEPAK